MSEFANDIRRYDADGQLRAQLSTNYTGTSPSDNATCSLAFGEHGALFTVGFDLRETENARGAGPADRRDRDQRRAQLPRSVSRGR